MKIILLPIAMTTLLGACATTRTVTAEERARCEQMAANMGIASRHDHDEEKGRGRSAMNLAHDRCRQIRDQASHAAAAG